MLGERTKLNSNHPRRMYDYFGSTLDKHGAKMVKDCNKVVAYEISDQKKTIVIDLKSSKTGKVFVVS